MFFSRFGHKEDFPRIHYRVVLNMWIIGGFTVRSIGRNRFVMRVRRNTVTIYLAVKNKA